VRETATPSMVTPTIPELGLLLRIDNETNNVFCENKLVMLSPLLNPRDTANVQRATYADESPNKHRMEVSDVHNECLT